MERISKLKQLDFLKPKRNFLTGESILLSGPKGYLIAKNLLYREDLSRPMAAIDFRQFEHDRMLIDCRLKL